MKLKKLRISNFRSYDSEGAELDLGSRINTIAGKNNAGKSTIFHALRYVKGEIGDARENHFAGDPSQASSVEVVFSLDPPEVESFYGLILRQVPSREEIISSRSKDFPEITYRRFGGAFETKIGPYPVKSSSIYRLGMDKELREKKNWKTRHSDLLKEFGFVKAIEELFRSPTDPEYNVSIEFGVVLENFFPNLLRSKLKIFPEFRLRPSGGDEGVAESFDGTQVASLLNTLKNGTTEQLRKWRRIRESFTDFYPSLILDVRRPSRQNPQVWVEKRDIDYDVTIEKVGAGISEFIVFLVHLIDSSETVFCLDNAEIHFHPHAQRKFLNLLGRYSQKNQFILISHSPNFVKPPSFSNLIIVREQNGKSTTHQPKLGWLTKEEERKLERDMTPELREIFFSDLSVFVEGPTEVGALPVFARSRNVDFDEMNVSIVRNPGSKYFDVPIKICGGFDIPFLAMCDRDALMDIETHYGRGEKKIECSPIVRVLLRFGLLDKSKKNPIYDSGSIQTKGNLKKYKQTLFAQLKEISRKNGIYVLSSKFETILKRAGYSKYFDEIEGQGVRSKPIIGKYVANKIVKNEEPIPNEILEFVDIIKTKGSHVDQVA